MELELDTFAKMILFGSTLEEKLVKVSSFSIPSGMSHPQKAMNIPGFPGRPPQLAKPGKAPFPSLNQLHKPTVRGEVLHFFANHELLAMELMALVLLRFPEAPSAFRQGLGRIIQEEQNHLQLYLNRMHELGVEFGDLSVSDYFWNNMKNMRSPLEFTVQMSLTFEQANLDFSLFFMNAMRREGDEETASLLERVFREEIGHVKHGLHWFNRWREKSTPESDWEAYLRLLPPPMTPRRAKGLEFCAEARRQGGLSETFIHELELYTGSKGRPPVVWIYNPHCDSEIARGRPGFTPTKGARRLAQDLEHIPMFLALDKDLVLVKNRPRSEWIDSLQKNGFKTPEFAENKSKPILQQIRAPKIGGLEPWGWSPDTFNLFQPLRSHLVEMNGGNSAWCHKIFNCETFPKTGFGKLFSKSWSVQFLQEWLKNHPEMHRFLGHPERHPEGHPETVGSIFVDEGSAIQRITQLLTAGCFAMVKAPYGTAGMQVKPVRTLQELNGPLGGWIKNIISSQGAIIVEHWLDKICDLSIQIEITDDQTHLLEVRQFITGIHNEYRGTYLGRKLSELASNHLRFLHSVLDPWHLLIRDLGSKLRKEGYRGPAGVDALLWRDKKGDIQMKPLVELNPRWTMGRVALALENHLLPGVNGIWAFLPIRELKTYNFKNAETFAEYLKSQYPLKRIQAGASLRIESGVVFTNDPSRAQEVLTVMGTLPNPDLENLLISRSQSNNSK